MQTEAARPPSGDAHQSWFGRFARMIAQWTGHPIGFGAAVSVVVAWAFSGPFFHFSDTWQLVINTGTTVVTFLMVFVIQHTQNRDAIAMHLKLDEIIRAVSEAHNAFLDLEDLEEGDLQSIRQRYEALAKAARDEAGENIDHVAAAEALLEAGDELHQRHQASDSNGSSPRK